MFNFSPTCKQKKPQMLTLSNLHFLLYMSTKRKISNKRLMCWAVGWLEAGRVFVSPRALRQEQHPRAAQEDDTDACCHGYGRERGWQGPMAFSRLALPPKGRQNPPRHLAEHSHRHLHTTAPCR